jgi:hypothetical protein
MCRRHPSLQVVETHSGGGQYDCLDLFQASDGPEQRPRISINRVGSLHFSPVSRSWEGWETFWQDYLSASDPLAVIDRVCTSADLTIPTRLPATTPPVVVFRFIAAFLSQTVLGRSKWECLNGYYDSSGGDGGRREEWFDLFPAARAACETREATDLVGEPAYRFWFLRKDDHPLLCLETTGRAWDGKGTEFDLLKLYLVRHRVWPVVSFVARDLLP